MLPEHLRPFFSDLGLQQVDLTAYPEYTIGRLLEYGDEAAVRWLRETFARAAIEDVIRRDRRLSRRSANFWALVYGIPREQVAALREPV
jgi:hypothetical protein